MIALHKAPERRVHAAILAVAPHHNPAHTSRQSSRPRVFALGKSLETPMNTAPDLTSSVTPHRMVAILNMPDVDAEELLYGRMRHLDKMEKLSYAEKGLICRSVKSYLLHEQRIDPDTGSPCTFTRWVRLACPWSYATAFSAKR